MEERSLKVVDSNKTFFGKLSKTLSKIIIPTKIGINGIVINLKRNNLLKAYEAMNNSRVVDEEKKKVLTSKYQEAYSLYLEAIDKYIMDTIYKKVKTNTASEFEKEAMGNYYKVTVLKDNEYVEYKYQKQKYLIELDYESLKLNSITWRLPVIHGHPWKNSSRSRFDRKTDGETSNTATPACSKQPWIKCTRVTLKG